MATPTGTPIGEISGPGLGPFGTITKELASGEAGGVTGLQKVSNIISGIIGILTVAAGIWFMIQFLIGSFYWITSGGDKGKLQEAKNRITHAFIGLIIVIAGWSIIALMGKFFNFDILLSEPRTIIRGLYPGGGQ